MNMKEALKWGEDNLTPKQFSNFQDMIFNANRYMTDNAYEYSNYFSQKYRECSTSDEVIAVREEYNEKRKALKEQIQALQDLDSALYKESEKKVEDITSKLYDEVKETAEFKEIIEKKDREWIGIEAVRLSRINEVVAKYQKKVQVSA